ncbi:MAG: ABC transporter permease subunit [Rhodocyclaceae bacterium]|jgi:NitT/TauT family transport system permease protein|nr:ABC transporter permease subunit [Rhodocyclaceae bacterium]MBK6677397.1 ABC transporter permease subunit [Rhodocyclaceae bacterium]MBK7814045.1 ABC transporter permease subunit [Rhodocyclaceae bacterium]MBK9310052.1 ABC transporter permease subunit [Rhodocyclaceae bacterium]
MSQGGTVATAGVGGAGAGIRAVRMVSRGAINFTVGLVILAILWAIGGHLIAANPKTANFAGFGLWPTLQAFPELWSMGKLQNATYASGYRLGTGLLIAIAIGIPIGILMGRVSWFRKLTDSPFQFLRMISPLSWMPITVLVFSAWDHSIIFLVAFASVWPVMYQTAAGLAKVDPAWFKVARNLGAKPLQMLTQIILPAISFDIFTGIRLALGVAWVVLVPAELLGVTSGLGYAIKDARETLAYDHLTAMVLTIGIIGYVLDTVCALLIKRFSWHRGDL